MIIFMQATEQYSPVVLFLCCEMRTGKRTERTKRDAIICAIPFVKARFKAVFKFACAVTTVVSLSLPNLPNSTETKVLIDGPNSKLHVLNLIC